MGLGGRLRRGWMQALRFFFGGGMVGAYQGRAALPAMQTAASVGAGLYQRTSGPSRNAWLAGVSFPKCL